uniref:Calmodulin-binding domain-containing protein n=1 Tax=Meloidogyne enterolobii TaxID=390850 RepID=A0A6V7V037_MELEN|nr:unnamed protein product [Meloidogyne enterolobii]
MAPPIGPNGRTLQKGITIGYAGVTSPRNSTSNRLPLSNRYNKSCDWLAPFPRAKCSIESYGHEENYSNSNYRLNPIAQKGFCPGDTCQTLTAGKSATPRGAISQQQSLEERCNGDLTQPPPSSILVNSSAGVCEGNNNNYLLSTTELNLPKSLEWSPTIEEEILNKNSNLADPQQQTNLLLLQQKQQQILRRRQSGYGISITTESQAKMRCKLQLTALKIVTKNSLPSLFLRSACVASTLLLIASLVNYHRTEVKIALIDSGAEDWRVAVTTDRIIKLFIEIFICAICPFPGSGTISWPYISADEHSFTKVSVPLDVLLAVPMFLRAYLLCRFMVLHSRQFQDAATRSIAALNRISMDFRFVIKTMMADHPMTVLVIFTCCYWVCMSWMFTQCERYNGREASTEYYYMNSLWFIMVTFMSIGYGDVVPTSYCGRLLSITTGIVGAGVSSALIAVISRKLELSRAEKHVNNFMADSKLTNARKNAAASVLQHTWFIHKYQQRNGHKGDEIRLRQHQRKFLNAINEFRRIKWDQRKLQERGNSLLDVGKLHTEMHETLWEMHRTQDQFVGMIEILTQRITELQQTVLNTSITQQQQQQIYPNNQLFPPNNDRKISTGTQLRVPLNNCRKVSSSNTNHPIPQQQQPNNLFLKTHPSIDNSTTKKQKNLNNSIIISGFESNLGLTNSLSSPCLQKSQQQQQTILNKMRVLVQNEDECIPLMNDGEGELMA